MEQGDKAESRRNRMTAIRGTLTQLPIFKQTTRQLERRIEEAHAHPDEKDSPVGSPHGSQGGH